MCKNFGRGHFEIFFFLFPEDFDISSKLSALETVYMKCQSLFSWKNKKVIINVSSDEYAQRIVD